MNGLSGEERNQVMDRLRRAYAFAERVSALSARNYLDHVILDSRPEPRPFRMLAEQWQWDLLLQITPALEAIAGVRKDYSGPRSFWFTLPRGHDKTSAIARLCNWILAFCRHRVTAVAGAADKEQAGLLSDFMEAEAKLNSWLAPRLHFKNYLVEGQHDSQLKIISAEAFSSFGLKSDLYVLDELTHWPKRDLFDVLISGREKRPGSALVIITNAGTVRSWQWNALQEAKRNPKDWVVFEANGRLASWMNDARVESMRRLLPAGMAKRVLDNKWIDPSEEAGFLTRAESELCIALGNELGLCRRAKGQPDIEYVAAIDYGMVKDRTVCVVVHRDSQRRIIVDRMDVMTGSKENRIRVDSIEAWIEEVRRDFNRPHLVVDPYQMESTIQKYEGRLKVERFESRGGKSNYEMAQNLRGLIVSNRLAFYPSCGEIIVDGEVSSLVDELSSLLLVPTSYGYRFDHTNHEHDDRAVALGMASLIATRMDERIKLKWSDSFF
jgi:hypothetical protein